MQYNANLNYECADYVLLKCYNKYQTIYKLGHLFIILLKYEGRVQHNLTILYYKAYKLPLKMTRD